MFLFNECSENCERAQLYFMQLSKTTIWFRKMENSISVHALFGAISHELPLYEIGSHVVTGEAWVTGVVTR